MSEHAGWSAVEAFGVPVRIFGRQVYYHRSREQHAIEHDHERLVKPNATESAVLEHILKLRVAAEGGKQ